MPSFFKIILSGIYGCPRDLCSVQYAKAILDYSRLSHVPLKEIHFVDTDLDMVRIIQRTFETMIPGKNVPRFHNTCKLEYVSPRSQSTVGKHVAKHIQIGKLYLLLFIISCEGCLSIGGWSSCCFQHM